MGYRGSYLWRLRQAVGNDLVLMPGAMVALQQDDQRVLLTKRTDDGAWCLGAPPEPLHSPTAHALELLSAYLRSGSFQVR